MSKKYFRVYTRLDVQEVRAHLLIYGDLAGQCAACRRMDIPLEAGACPECRTEFRYLAFRRVRQHLPKLVRILEERPELVVVDYDDFRRNTGLLKAEELLS